MAIPEFACDVGDVVRLSLLAEVLGVPTDPATLLLKVKDPAGNTVEYSGGSLVAGGVGHYHYDLSVLLPGRHYYRWIGTGAAQAQEESNFFVRTPEIP